MSGGLRRTACLARWIGGALTAAALLAGCSSDKPKPTALEAFTPSITGRQLWSANIGSIDFPLSVAVRNGQFIAASSNGTVLALQADTGAEVWRAQAGAPLTAGVGSDGRYSAVVTRDNEVVAFDGAKVAWRQRIAARVVTAPLVAGERVFVVSVDRTVHAFDVLDGRIARWWMPDGSGFARLQTRQKLNGIPCSIRRSWRLITKRFWIMRCGGCATRSNGRRLGMNCCRKNLRCPNFSACTKSSCRNP